MPALKPLPLTRVVAAPAALDGADFGDALQLRVAADEVFVGAEINAETLADEHAIITREASLVGAWLGAADAAAFLERECCWRIPDERPAFTQGAVAHLPVKLYLEQSGVLIMTPAPYRAELEPRLLPYPELQDSQTL